MVNERETEVAVDPPRPSIPAAELPPGPPEWPLIGQALRLRRDSIGLIQEAAAYGDVSKVSVRPVLLYLVNHPDLIEAVLVTNHRKVGKGVTTTKVLTWLMGRSISTTNDPAHLRQRRIMQPQLSRRCIDKYGGIMTEFASRQAESWSDGATVHMATEMRTMTLQILAKALFGIELPDTVWRIGAAFEYTNDYMYFRLTQPPFLRPLLHHLPLPSSRRFKNARAYLDETIYGMIEERRQSGAQEDDLLSLLLEARYEDAESEEDSKMSDEQLRDEISTMYIAGHDTTANTLTWAFYLLAEHPEVQDRFHAELDKVLAGRPAALDDLPNLPFTYQILTEVLRLYPPFWSLARMVFEPIEVDGYHIPPGVTVLICPFITQRDRRWFDSPREFRPERWTDGFRKSLPRYAYFPFGAGPHHCIGEGFAWMEAQIALATLGQRWRVRSDHRHKAVILPRITLIPEGNMPLIVERRI